MKTSIRLTVSALFLAVGVLSALPGLSQNTYYTEKTFAVTMYPAAADSKIWLSLEQYKPEEKVSLKLVDQKGQVLFDEILAGNPGKRNAYRQQFDMSQLKDGKYTFHVAAGGRKEEFTFNLSTPSLEQALPPRLIAIN